MKETVLGVDIETASALDIKNGAWAYSQHPSTCVYCVVFTLARESCDYDYIVWEPGDKLPRDVVRHILNGGRVIAHNAGFEKSIFTNILNKDYEFPKIKRSQWIDTQAMGNTINLPMTLEGLANALGCGIKKDIEGSKVMIKMTKTEWDEEEDDWVYPNDTPENRARLVEYCALDVGAMMDSYFLMPELSFMEQRVWECDCVINERGVYLDQEFAAACTEVADARSGELSDEAFLHSNGHLPNSTGAPALKKWLEMKDVKLPMANRKGKDGKFTKTPCADKQAIGNLLDTKLPDDVRLVFENRMEANKVASLSKLKRVPTMVGTDGRLKFSLNFQGTSTGRWIAYGLQIQNMPKTKMSPSRFDLVRVMLSLKSLEGLKMVADRPLEAISQCLRSIVSAPEGRELIAGDFSSIEARGVAWLAGQDDVIKKFHEGADIYVYTASTIGANCDHEWAKSCMKCAEHRQLGKVCTLALGFGMGDLKFHAEAAKYGIPLELLQARKIKKIWRKNNNKIVEFWGNLENAVRDAINNKGDVKKVGRLTIWCKKTCLFIRLPSGRTLRYWKPTVKLTTRKIDTVDDEGNIVEIEMTSHEIRYFQVADDKTTMKRDFLYGGKIADHVTQALARDLLAVAMMRVEETDPYDVVIHVHDSVCAEVPEGSGDVDEFCAIMEELPSWAHGMPVAVEGYRDRCFRG